MTIKIDDERSMFNIGRIIVSKISENKSGKGEFMRSFGPTMKYDEPNLGIYLQRTYS